MVLRFAIVFCLLLLVAAPNAALGAEPRHVEIASPWGHDSFLMDIPAYHEAVAGLLSG